MARDEDRLWDPDDAVGYGPHSGAHRWAHEWMFWLSTVCALAGVLTLKRADRGSSGSWLAVTLMLVAGGATVFVLDS